MLGNASRISFINFTSSTHTVWISEWPARNVVRSSTRNSSLGIYPRLNLVIPGQWSRTCFKTCTSFSLCEIIKCVMTLLVIFFSANSGKMLHRKLSMCRLGKLFTRSEILLSVALDPSLKRRQRRLWLWYSAIAFSSLDVKCSAAGSYKHSNPGFKDFIRS